MNTRGVVILTLVVLTSCGLFPALASADDTVETGRLLAVLLDSGRVVIGVNQAMINDIEQGNKGFTVEVFEKQMSEKFKARTGVDLANIKNEKVPAQAKVLLPMLMEAGKTVTRNYQPIINKQGMGFKNFIPATWGTQAAALFTAESGAYMKQTAPVKLVRNQKNVPDEFEAATLAKFADPAYPRVGEKVISAAADGGKTVRVVLPLFYGKGCLGCHGEPKNEKDISGYLKDGGKEGDLGGAISVKLAVK